MKYAFLDNNLICKGKDCLDKLEVLHEFKVFKKKPSECPNCDSKKLDGLEIVGIKEGSLFWECEECMFKFLKYSIRKTLGFLSNAEGYWYNPNDWKNQERN